MALFIIDFDFTLTNGHTHNTIARFYKPIVGPDQQWTTEEEAAQWQLIKHIPAIQAPNATWKTIITNMLIQGHHVAIASFNSFPAIIPRYLQEVIGLAPEQVKQIFIEAWLPENPNTADKNQHILNILQHYQWKGSPSDVYLIDDSKTNLAAATAAKYNVIPAYASHLPMQQGSHLSVLARLLNSQNR